MVEEDIVKKSTLQISNIPLTAIAKDLLHYLETQMGKDSIFALEIQTDHKNWKSRGFGRVQFTTLAQKDMALSLSRQNRLVFNAQSLKLSETYDDIIHRPLEPENRVEDAILHLGFLKDDNLLCVLETWGDVRVWIMPERRRVEFWVSYGECCYKVEIRFEDVLESVGCCLGGDGGGVDALLLKLRYGPRIYQKISGPGVSSKFQTDRYHFCKEDFDFLWVRTTDFSSIKSIGQSTTFCWEIGEGLSNSKIFTCFPYYKEASKILVLEDGEEFASLSKTDPVPLVNFLPDLNQLPYEITFKLNSLIHTQKISLSSVNSDLIKVLSELSMETAIMVLQKLQNLILTCYDPVSFVKKQLLVPSRNLKKPPPPSQKSLANRNIMQCHRALITPLKIYCLGPELESSNYVVRNFAAHASDFMRVTFVEEDWSKLPPNAISSRIRDGISKPYRTKLYHRILWILHYGITIGGKKYEFLAFSASQLRSNSVWMFASNVTLKAEDIREWMGCFNAIRSVSKCAARMGQLFSSSKQTFNVPLHDVESIPDIELTTEDGINYCFSDGIGKISLQFAKQVAEKCGLSETPSAFQIRYGGYKGVISVDRNSFRKLSLRKSMLKFESDNAMLNVTNWSEAMPCYLNREIVSLLSTLGVKDEVFEKLLNNQLLALSEMLKNRSVALEVLENLTWAVSKHVLIKMLRHGYEPNMEPYLLMMLQAYNENLLLDLKTRCRIFVPKGRILMGCLDETGVLDYGQVYVRVKMTKAEIESGDQSFLKVDEKTAVLVGKVVVTKNPCLHPGDIRVLEAVYEVALEEKSMVDCILFPQRGKRPHPNECSGGDLDGDLYFISWDKGLIPPRTETPMDYLARRPRIMDHKVTLEEIHKFFVDYLINDTLGAISTAHLVHADREPEKARSRKCLQLADLHSMAVDFAKTGAPAEMPRALKPKVFPDFMERFDKPTYISSGPVGKLYRAVNSTVHETSSKFTLPEMIGDGFYDGALEVEGFEDSLGLALMHKDIYMEKMQILMNFYDAKTEDEILTGNLRNKAMYLQRDNRRYGEVKDRILLSMKSLRFEMKEIFEGSCRERDEHEQERLASAWYHVTYHPQYYFRKDGLKYLSFPWIVGDVLLNIKARNHRKSAE